MSSLPIHVDVQDVELVAWAEPRAESEALVRWRVSKSENTKRLKALLAFAGVTVAALAGASHLPWGDDSDEPVETAVSTIDADSPPPMPLIVYIATEPNLPENDPRGPTVEIPPVTANPEPGSLYIVQPGDDLTILTADLFGSDGDVLTHRRWINGILALNPMIVDQDHIEPGWVLMIPLEPFQPDGGTVER